MQIINFEISNKTTHVFTLSEVIFPLEAVTLEGVEPGAEIGISGGMVFRSTAEFRNTATLRWTSSGTNEIRLFFDWEADKGVETIVVDPSTPEDAEIEFKVVRRLIYHENAVLFSLAIFRKL